ncbi:MAG TPA: hypothetical protein VMR75_04025 [Candidatus Saccharimonadales bacterium]|nr:hypothetical protein [Candidatus Saccharimonadales bacterium]
MSKKTDRTDSFRQELSKRERSPESISHDSGATKTVGLSEDQLVKLGDDIRRPIKDPSSATNPMQ